jgi:hypothetical protein
LLEPVRQRGAGACGTVDCCHERESQTHLWEAPSGGPHRPFAQGAHQPHLTTEHAHTGLPVGGPVVARSDRASTPSGFTSQPRRDSAVRGEADQATASPAPSESHGRRRRARPRVVSSRRVVPIPVGFRSVMFASVSVSVTTRARTILRGSNGLARFGQASPARRPGASSSRRSRGGSRDDCVGPQCAAAPLSAEDQHAVGTQRD